MYVYSTAQRHCPLTRRPEPARALIVNIYGMVIVYLTQHISIHI